MAYATPAQYRATPGVPAVTDDAQLLALLDTASGRLDELTVGAIYLVDADGMPTTAGVVSAFRTACIQQAAHQQTTPEEEQDGVPQGAMTLGPLQLSASSGSSARFSSSALSTLRTAGLISSRVQTW